MWVLSMFSKVHSEYLAVLNVAEICAERREVLNSLNASSSAHGFHYFPNKSVYLVFILVLDLKVLSSSTQLKLDEYTFC